LGFVVEPGGGIGLVVDEPGPGDRAYAVDGRTVLFVAAEAGDRLAGRVLDRTGADAAGRFTLLPADGGAR
jgi:hypothetical protein